MAKEYFIYSTLANSQIYVGYRVGPNDIPTMDEGTQVHIKGGAGVADRNGVAPFGVLTKVTDEQLGYLKSNDGFNEHVKRGFLQIRDSKVDTEVAAADMEPRDNSAQLVEEDYVEGKAPVINDEAPTQARIAPANSRRA